MDLLTKSHFFQCFFGSVFSLFSGDAGNGQGQFHIGEDALVGDEIIALEHKPDGMVSIGIPVSVFILLGGDGIDDEVSAVIAVQPSDDVKERGLSGSTGTQDGHELIISQVQAHSVQSSLNEVSCLILLTDVFNLQHMFVSFF